jgi:hypothetical protein
MCSRPASHISLPTGRCSPPTLPPLHSLSTPAANVAALARCHRHRPLASPPSSLARRASARVGVRATVLAARLALLILLCLSGVRSSRPLRAGTYRSRTACSTATCPPPLPRRLHACVLLPPSSVVVLAAVSVDIAPNQHVDNLLRSTGADADIEDHTGSATDNSRGVSTRLPTKSQRWWRRTERPLLCASSCLRPRHGLQFAPDMRAPLTPSLMSYAEIYYVVPVAYISHAQAASQSTQPQH